jgi:prolipoprotein diacylglyceryl transferase
VNAPTVLAAIPSPSQGVWHLGPIPVRAYALCIVLGIIAACVITEIRMRRRGAPPYAVLDIAVWAVPAGIIGARIYHVITSPDDYFGAHGNWVNALRIWHGGLGIWGAVAGGAVGAWIAARRLGIPLSFVADALAPGLPVAQAIGRLGNWFNNELYGRATTLPWGLRIYNWDPAKGQAVLDEANKPDPKPGLYHPTFLYELIWDLGVAVLVWQLDRRYKFGRGRAFALYVMAYTVGRFWIEALRIDDAHHFLGMRVNSWVSILVFVGALVYFLRVRGPQQRLVTDEAGGVRVVPAGAPDAMEPEVSAEEEPVAANGAPADEAADTGPPGAEPAATGEPEGAAESEAEDDAEPESEAAAEPEGEAGAEPEATGEPEAAADEEAAPEGDAEPAQAGESRPAQ